MSASSLTPMLTVKEAVAPIEFYRDAFARSFPCGTSGSNPVGSTIQLLARNAADVRDHVVSPYASW
jgi:hypothetical protein